MLLIGGTRGGATLGDLWAWDGNDWTMLAAPARSNPTLAYDEARDRLVLHGNQPLLRNGYDTQDTWEWDGTTWTQRATVGVPSSGQGMPIVYDPIRRRVVGLDSLYDGSRRVDGVNSQLCEWDGTAWTCNPTDGAATGTGWPLFGPLFYKTSTRELILSQFMTLWTGDGDLRGPSSGSDSGADAGADKPGDAGADVPGDAGTDALADTGADGRADAPADAGADAPVDAGADGTDAPADAGCVGGNCPCVPGTVTCGWDPLVNQFRQLSCRPDGGSDYVRCNNGCDDSTGQCGTMCLSTQIACSYIGGNTYANFCRNGQLVSQNCQVCAGHPEPPVGGCADGVGCCGNIGQPCCGGVSCGEFLTCTGGICYDYCT